MHHVNKFINCTKCLLLCTLVAQILNVYLMPFGGKFLASDSAWGKVRHF